MTHMYIDIDVWAKTGRVVGYEGLPSQTHAAAHKAAPYPSTPQSGRAYTGRMSECKHLLTILTCSLCRELVDDLEEPAHERKDYAQRELTDGETPKQLIPNYDLHSDRSAIQASTEVVDIYGVNKVRRLKRGN